MTRVERCTRARVVAVVLLAGWTVAISGVLAGCVSPHITLEPISDSPGAPAGAKLPLSAALLFPPGSFPSLMNSCDKTLNYRWKKFHVEQALTLTIENEVRRAFNEVELVEDASGAKDLNVLITTELVSMRPSTSNEAEAAKADQDAWRARQENIDYNRTFPGKDGTSSDPGWVTPMGGELAIVTSYAHLAVNVIDPETKRVIASFNLPLLDLAAYVSSTESCINAAKAALLTGLSDLGPALMASQELRGYKDAKFESSGAIKAAKLALANAHERNAFVHFTR